RIARSALDSHDAHRFHSFRSIRGAVPRGRFASARKIQRGRAADHGQSCRRSRGSLASGAMDRSDYIASDVHLGAVPRETETAFLDFLEHVGAHARSLLLVGDLFDFWFEYGPVIPGKHFRVLAALRELVDAGVPVTLMGGNHDAWGGRFLREEVGVAFHADAIEMELGGRRALVAHGDGVGRGDLKYRALKAVIRSRPAILGFRLLHPELGMRLAGAVSTTEHKVENDDRARSRAEFIAEWARERLRAA